MPTLITSPRHTDDVQALLHAAHLLGWQTHQCASWRVPVELAGAGAVLYGEPLFVELAASTLGLALIQPSNDWLPGLPETYRKRKIGLTTLGEARQIPAPGFIKPVEEKCFPAQIYAWGAAIPHVDLLPDSTPVYVSDIVEWSVEYRCYVQDRQLRTCSSYWRDRALTRQNDGTWLAPPAELEAATAFLQQMLSDANVSLPPACVIDIGFIAGVGWAVIEANSVWGAGIYGCDSAQVLQVLRGAVLSPERLLPEYHHWTRPLPQIQESLSAAFEGE